VSSGTSTLGPQKQNENRLVTKCSFINQNPN